MLQMKPLDLDKKTKKGSYKTYLKLVKKYRKSMKAFIKDANPFDYDAVYLFVLFLRFMHDYYVADNNVTSGELRGHERTTKIGEALAEFDRWDNYESLHETEYETARECRLDDTEDICHARIHDYFIKANQEKEEHWNKFWEIIRDEFLYWWD